MKWPPVAFENENHYLRHMLVGDVVGQTGAGNLSIFPPNRLVLVKKNIKTSE